MPTYGVVARRKYSVDPARVKRNGLFAGPVGEKGPPVCNCFLQRESIGGKKGYRPGVQRGRGAEHKDRFELKEIQKLIKDRALLSCSPFHQRSVANGTGSDLVGSNHRLSGRWTRHVPILFSLFSSFSPFTYRRSREIANGPGQRNGQRYLSDHRLGNNRETKQSYRSRRKIPSE